MIRHMRHGSPPRLMALQSILSPNRRESLPTPSAGVRITPAAASARASKPRPHHALWQAALLQAVEHRGDVGQKHNSKHNARQNIHHSTLQAYKNIKSELRECPMNAKGEAQSIRAEG